MIIENYQFGGITINSVHYTSDVIIFSDYVKSNWWRKEGHSLCVEDLDEVLKSNPDILIIGTGCYGVMKVPEKIIEHLNNKGIQVIILKTGEAVKKFNEFCAEEKGNSEPPKKNVVAGLHLTC